MQVEELTTYQSDVVKYLLNAKRKNRLVHAYLFEGEAGTGTYEAALYFAMMMLCDKEEPCLKCNTCERIKYNSHMNVVTIEPIDGVIRRDQIDSLMSDFTHTTLEEGACIYIIKDADLMNQSSANALLKMLEEPIPGHYCILTTTNHKRMLDTIVSRCQYIHFKPLNPKLIEEGLINKGIDKDLAFVISNVTLDSSIAIKYAEEGKLEKLYTLVCKILTAKQRRKDPYLEYFLYKDILLPESKEWNIMFLEIFLIVLKEIIKLKEQSSNYFENLNTYAENNTSEAIFKRIEIVSEYIKKINSPVNLDLFYSSLFLQL